MPEEKKKSVNKMMLVIVLLLVLLICAGVFIVVMFLSKPSETESAGNLVEYTEDGTFVSLKMDTHLVLDENDLISDQELQQRIDDATMNLRFSDVIVIENGKEGVCDIANSGANNKDMFVSLWLIDTEEEIYRSGVIPIGNKIQQLELNRSLERGNYRGLLVYNQLKENKVVGQVNVEVTLDVKS